MKQFGAYILVAIVLSSCSKQSIADAMLQKEEQGSGGGSISMSYQVNGALVKTVVSDAANQGSLKKLVCQKSFYDINGMNYYRFVLSLGSTSSELVFLFYTDSIRTTNYVYRSSSGTQHFLYYNNINGYIHDATDSMSINITTNTNNRISGNFSGRLTPDGPTPNTYGAAGSIAITNGTFENIPLVY